MNFNLQMRLNANSNVNATITAYWQVSTSFIAPNSLKTHMLH